MTAVTELAGPFAGAGGRSRTNRVLALDLLPDADPHVFARCGHWTKVERAPRVQCPGRRFPEPNFLSGETR